MLRGSCCTRVPSPNFLANTAKLEDVAEYSIAPRMPQASSVPTSAPRSEPLVVTVTQQGGYRVNEHELINSSPETLRAALLKEAGSARGMRVTIRADARATHQSVITAMDVLGRLGFMEINIATVKDEPAPRP